MDLDFTSLDVLFVQGKIDRGEEVTDDERNILKEAIRQRQIRNKTEALQAKAHEEQQRRMRDAAIEKATNKYCPLLERYCQGEECAWFKVLKGNKPDLDKFWHYDAMCAIQIPTLNTHIDREDN